MISRAVLFPLVLLGATVPAVLSCQQPRPSTRTATVDQQQTEKLKALDEALRAGVLSQAEYNAKKKALLAATPASPAVPAAEPGRRAGAGTAASAAGHYTRMKMVKIMDTQGWGQPVEVARLLLPSDWRTEGGVNWVQNMTRCPQNIIQASFRATSPDGLTGFEVMPQYSWLWSDDPMLLQSIQSNAANKMGCDGRPPMRATEFLTNLVVPALRRGARVAGGEPLPGIAQVQQTRMNANYAQMMQAGYLRYVRADAGRVRLEYAVNGKPVEEWVSATVTTSATPMASSAGLMNGNMNRDANSFTMMAFDLYALRAPRGELEQNARLFAMIVSSIRPNPQYSAAVGQWLASMGRIQQQGAMDRHKIWQEAQAYISNSIQQTYQENQVVQDRIADQFGQMIKGVETYIDPRSNERIELSAGWVNAYSNGKGEYILVDSPNINPAQLFQEDWREMARPPRR